MTRLGSAASVKCAVDPACHPSITGRACIWRDSRKRRDQVGCRDRRALPWKRDVIRVLLADDQQLVRRGVRSLLETAGFHVVAEASDGFEAVQLAERLKPEVAVLDLAIPLLNGADAARQIRRACPETRAVILTMYDEPHHVLAALRAGV